MPRWRSRSDLGQNGSAVGPPLMPPPLLPNRTLLLQRAPRRISVSVSHALFCQLQALADQEGRSTSNLCAYLLERAMQNTKEAAQRSAARP